MPDLYPSLTIPPSSHHHQQEDSTMTEATETDPWADRVIWGTGDLAVFLGGSESSFTGMLLVLIAKAQATPGNFSRLEMAFPEAVAAWRQWQSMSPTPTFRQLREALDGHQERD